jgi:uncharacterized Zn-binding protein involved in type VI secretion
VHAGFCNPKGRLLAFFHVVKYLDSYLLFFPKSIAENITKKLSMYILRSNVKLDLDPDELMYFGLYANNQDGQLDLFNPDEKIVNIKHIGDMPKHGGKLINKAYKHKPVAYTVKAFAQKFSKGTYVILVHKHALAIEDGVVIDNGDKQFNGYRRVVESAFLVK